MAICTLRKQENDKRRARRGNRQKREAARTPAAVHEAERVQEQPIKRTTKKVSDRILSLERETGIEPATPSLARRCSTAEPLAHIYFEKESG